MRFDVSLRTPNYLLKSFCLTALHQSGDQATALKIAEALFPRQLIGNTPNETEAIWLIDAVTSAWTPILSAPATAWLRADPRFLNSPGGRELALLAV